MWTSPPRAISSTMPGSSRFSTRATMVAQRRSNPAVGVAMLYAGACGTVRVTVDVVRIATWNVNSVKQRVPRLLPWLDERRPDVACLQETKLSDDAFRGLLGDKLADRGYAVAVHGEATWNGVAILSRVGLDDGVAGL